MLRQDSIPLPHHTVSEETGPHIEFFASQRRYAGEALKHGTPDAQTYQKVTCLIHYFFFSNNLVASFRVPISLVPSAILIFVVPFFQSGLAFR